MIKSVDTLAQHLPKVRGKYSFDVPLSPIAWFRVGGTAEVLFCPQDEEDLSYFLKNKPKGIPVTIFGSGSNILVRDGGIPGVVIRLGRNFRQTEIVWKGKTAFIKVGAGAIDIRVARYCRDAGVAGLEFLVGVPGTIGGALRMNAGAYGYEMSDVTLEAQALDRLGNLRVLKLIDLGFSYRQSKIPEDWIFISAILRGTGDERELIARRIREIETNRNNSQPLRTRTGGSTFTNPPGKKAWELIDQAGCRGLRHGGAMVSEKHCNFLINTGDASAADIEWLGEEVRRRVKQKSGINFKWEIQRMGLPKDRNLGAGIHEKDIRQ